MARTLKTATTLASCALLTWLPFVACGGNEDAGVGGNNVPFGGSGGSAGNAGSAGSSGNGGNGASSTGGSFNIDSGVTDGGLNADSACQASSAEATLVKKPVDIIFVIDNSGSMGGEIQAVQNNISLNFANIIGASGIDFRVIMVTSHGRLSGESVCIEAPLSGIPVGGCASNPPQPVNTANFFHYHVEVESHDSLCRLLDTFNEPDSHGFAPNGWSQWLRDDSFKMFVEITDDGINCASTVAGRSFNDRDTVADAPAVAASFDEALRTLSPLHFGEISGERNYRWYSIVGMDENTPATEPWPPTEPIQDARCASGSSGNGTGYQALSILTEALRYPSCENASFDAIFLAIAEGVISGSQVACEFEIEPPENGQTIDLETVLVNYTPGGGGADQVFQQVANAAACTANSFYIENNTVFLCPDVCSVVQQDDAAKIGILFGCEVEGPN